jgi:hypothetical protein
MFGDGSLTFREFAMKEPLPLARIHDAVIDFLRNREDAGACDRLNPKATRIDVT